MKKTAPTILILLLLSTGCATRHALEVSNRPVALPSATLASAPVDSPSTPVDSSSAPAVGTTFSLFPQLKHDAVQMATAPLHWEGGDWAKFGLGVAAVGGAILLDRDLRRIVERNSTSGLVRVADAVAPFGSYYSFGVLGGFYLGGKLFQNDKALSVAQDGLASSAIAAGVISPLLKLAVRRERPNQADSTFDRDRGGMSFPSGHTTQAFAVASVIAAHYDSFWVRAAAYSLAGLVGLSRMQQGEHYASDVLAGALIGTAVGNAVVKFHESERLHIAFAPSMNPRSGGVAVGLRFDFGDR
jgi:hypothetical protein